MKTMRLLALALTLLTVNVAFATDEIHWTVTGQNSVAFNWRGTTTEQTIGHGLTSGNYTQVTATTPKPVPVSSRGPFWEAELTGLTANTRYYYQIGTRAEHSFSTPPAPGSSNFYVYAQGNICSTSTYFNTGLVQDIIANDLPSFVVRLGDLTRANIDGKTIIDQHLNDVMVWSTEAAYMPVRGDIDTVLSIKESFASYKVCFAVPNPQTPPGSPLAGGEDRHWFDYGNVRFITMPGPWTGAWADWKIKTSTLMAQAQADSNIKFIVTFVHEPAYSSGHFTGPSTLKGILDALGDTYSKYKLNVSAHSNNYERSLPQHGVIHVNAGTGGANLVQDGPCLWLTCEQPSWSAFRAMHLCALKLHFTASGIEGSFIYGPAGGGTNDVNCTEGSVIDYFTIGSPYTFASSVCAPAPTSPLVVNVRDKGAKGNGVTNDTAAIQAAINQVGGTGGTVYVPDGTYMINALTSLKPKSNMTFRMAGGAILKAIPNNSPNIYALIRIEGVSNVNVVGGTVQGERYGHTGTTGEFGMGIFIASSKTVVIEGVTAKDNWGDGFYIGYNSANAKFCSVVADNNRRQGASIVYVNGILVKNSIFKNTHGTPPEAGIDVEPGKGQNVNKVQILTSQFLGNQGSGLVVNAMNGPITNVTIDGNTMSTSKWHGLTVYQTSGHLVTNNKLNNNGDVGIVIGKMSTNIIVTGNTTNNNDYVGILMKDGATNNTITNNTATDNSKRNIWDMVGGNNISGNTAP